MSALEIYGSFLGRPLLRMQDPIYTTDLALARVVHEPGNASQTRLIRLTNGVVASGLSAKSDFVRERFDSSLGNAVLPRGIPAELQPTSPGIDWSGGCVQRRPARVANLCLELSSFDCPPR
jgi:hypothetical protein